jgi:hypothetical protein
MAPSLATSLRWIAITISFCAVFATAVISPLIGTAADEGDDAKDIEIAKSLAALLSAGLTVISRNQVLIDSPDIEDKGLDGKTVLEQARKVYMDATGSDPSKIDPSSRHARLLEVEMNAIVDVMNAHQRELNQRGVGFKGFIPATFGRLITESFSKGAGGNAEIKITAPPEFIRNRKARPDNWEGAVIRDKLLSPSWPKGQYYAAVADSKGRSAFRVTVPEYYSASCLNCHGSPKGEIDVTGYPKEGRGEDDLGGVISITLYR